MSLPTLEWVPVVASIPHGGDYIPPEIGERLLVPIERNYADWYTRELFSFLPELGIPTVSSTAHRLVADVNRHSASGASPWPRGVVATTSARNEPLYNEPVLDSEVERRVAMAHSPFHYALDSLLDEALRKFDSVVLLDLHSFGLPIGVDVVIGDKRGLTADPTVMDAIEEVFLGHGFTTQRNETFSGGSVIERFVDNPAVNAVILELNQRVYLDPAEIDRKDWRRPSFAEDYLDQAGFKLRAVFSALIVRFTSNEE